MPPFLPQVTAQINPNALRADFSPIVQVLQNRKKQQALEQQQKSETAGNLAFMLQNTQDPEQRAALEGMLQQSNPGVDPRMLVAQAGLGEATQRARTATRNANTAETRAQTARQNAGKRGAGRKIARGPDGVPRFVDTGESVFPDAPVVSKGYQERFQTARGLGYDEQTSARFAGKTLKLEKDEVTNENFLVDKITGQEFLPNAAPQSRQQRPQGPPQQGGVPQGQGNLLETGGDIQPIVNNEGVQNVQPVQRTGRAATAPRAAPPSPRQSRSDPSSLYNTADLFTGALNTVGLGLTGATEQIPVVGGSLVSRKAKIAEKKFDLSMQNLIRTLSNNRRFPTTEQAIIRGFVERGMLESPGNVRASLEALDDHLFEKLKIENEVFNDRKMPKELRKEAAASRIAIGTFRKTMGVPPKLSGRAELKQMIKDGILKKGDLFRFGSKVKRLE